MYKRTVEKLLLVLLLTILYIPGIYSAGTNEVEARDLQFTDPYEHLDLPYTAGLSLRDTPIELAFDFTRQKTTHYQYRELIDTIEIDTAGMVERTTNQKVNADMVVQQNGMGFADIIYRNMISTIKKTISDTAGDAVLKSEETSDPVSVTHAGYNYKGIYPYDTTLDFTYNLQFPITNTEIRAGTTVSIPISMPVITLNKEIAAEGKMVLTHVGFVEIAGERYAKLLAEISIENPLITGESGSKNSLGTEFSLNLSGYGVYYYNIAEKNFYYGHVQFETTMETAALMPIFTKFSTPGQKAEKRTLSSRVSIRYEQLK